MNTYAAPMQRYRVYLFYWRCLGYQYYNTLNLRLRTFLIKLFYRRSVVCSPNMCMLLIGGIRCMSELCVPHLELGAAAEPR